MDDFAAVCGSTKEQSSKLQRKQNLRRRSQNKDGANDSSSTSVYAPESNQNESDVLYVGDLTTDAFYSNDFRFRATSW